jgi:uncharacterized protein YdcH (DUF465 family)
VDQLRTSDLSPRPVRKFKFKPHFRLATNTAHIAQLFDGYNQLEAIKKQANRIDVYAAGLGAEVADLRKSVDENHNKFTR